MITRIEAEHYRCLRSIRQPLQRFEILIGPNGSGKSTFLDVIAFLCTLITDGLDAAVSERSEDMHDLVWGRIGHAFELKVEARVSSKLRSEIELDTIAYHVAIRLDTQTEQLEIWKEFLRLGDSRTVISRGAGESQVTTEDGLQTIRSNIPSRTSALSRLLPDDDRFPYCNWFRELLTDNIQSVQLCSSDLRKPSPPVFKSSSMVTGSNLARMVAQLADEPELFSSWIAHLQTSLPDLESVRTILRPEDRHRYLLLRFRDGIEAPSWIVSDGTLRLLALTILSYLPKNDKIYLVEEPENGLHPTAIESVYQSLSSIYDGQVLVASHSPVLLALAQPKELLCFRKSSSGCEVYRGSDIPELRQWHGEVSLGTLFGTGVLG